MNWSFFPKSSKIITFLNHSAINNRNCDCLAVHVFSFDFSTFFPPPGFIIGSNHDGGREVVDDQCGRPFIESVMGRGQ